MKVKRKVTEKPCDTWKVATVSGAAIQAAPTLIWAAVTVAVTACLSWMTRMTNTVNAEGYAGPVPIPVTRVPVACAGAKPIQP